jgi:transposase-like protein
MGKGRADKETVRSEYISSDISLRQLAKKHKIAQSTIFKWSREGQWNVEKQKFLQSAAHLAQVELNAEKEQILKTLTDRWEEVYKTADKLLEKVNTLLDLPGTTLAPRDLKSISSVLVDYVTLHSYGAKRDKEKGEIEDEDGGGIVINFADAAEEWAG